MDQFALAVARGIILKESGAIDPQGFPLPGLPPLQMPGNPISSPAPGTAAPQQVASAPSATDPDQVIDAVANSDLLPLLSKSDLLPPDPLDDDAINRLIDKVTDTIDDPPPGGTPPDPSVGAAIAGADKVASTTPADAAAQQAALEDVRKAYKQYDDDTVLLENVKKRRSDLGWYVANRRPEDYPPDLQEQIATKGGVSALTNDLDDQITRYGDRQAASWYAYRDAYDRADQAHALGEPWPQ